MGLFSFIFGKKENEENGMDQSLDDQLKNLKKRRNNINKRLLELEKYFKKLSDKEEKKKIKGMINRLKEKEKMLNDSIDEIEESKKNEKKAQNVYKMTEEDIREAEEMRKELEGNR